MTKIYKHGTVLLTYVCLILQINISGLYLKVIQPSIKQSEVRPLLAVTVVGLASWSVISFTFLVYFFLCLEDKKARYH